MMNENILNQESAEQATNIKELPKFSYQEVVSVNTTIDNAITLLGNVNFEVVDLLLERTPPDLQTNLNYQILLLTKEFNEKMQELFKSRDSELETED